MGRQTLLFPSLDFMTLVVWTGVKNSITLVYKHLGILSLSNGLKHISLPDHIEKYTVMFNKNEM